MPTVLDTIVVDLAHLDDDTILALHAAGPLWCAECGSDDAARYVVTWTGDRDDPEARTEVCQPCDVALADGEPDDECEATGGRCDTCGAPSDPDGCTRSRGHDVARDVDLHPAPGADPREYAGLIGAEVRRRCAAAAHPRWYGATACACQGGPANVPDYGPASPDVPALDLTPRPAGAYADVLLAARD